MRGKVCLGDFHLYFHFLQCQLYLCMNLSSLSVKLILSYIKICHYVSNLPHCLPHCLPHYECVSSGDDLDDDLELVEELALQVYRSHPTLLSRGFALSHPPTIHQTLDGVIPFRWALCFFRCISVHWDGQNFFSGAFWPQICILYVVAPSCGLLLFMVSWFLMIGPDSHRWALVSFTESSLLIQALASSSICRSWFLLKGSGSSHSYHKSNTVHFTAHEPEWCINMSLFHS